MEALLLTFDVIFFIWLLINVGKATEKVNPKYFGIFGYRDERDENKSKEK